MKSVTCMKFLGCMLVFFLALFLYAIASAATVASGRCGDNALWELDDAGKLTISGTGTMEDYNEDPVGQWHYDRYGKVKTIVVNDGITSIGDFAFAYCQNATSITIPDSVTHIGWGAFRNTKIERIELPQNIEYIGPYAFSSCSNLKSISIPDKITELKEELFSGCYSLCSIEFPSDLRIIEEFVFDWCIGLESIVIPDTVVSLGRSVFYNCSNLVSVILPENLSSIGERAFFNCYNCEFFSSVPLRREFFF